MYFKNDEYIKVIKSLRKDILSMPKFIIGTKFHKYDDDGNLVVKRITRVSDERYELKDIKGGSKTSIIISENDLANDYVLLSPDTLISLSGTVDKENIPDFYVCVHRMEDLQNGEKRPAIILRQNVYNDTKNMEAQMTGKDLNGWYVGECRSITSEGSFDYVKDFMDIATVGFSMAIAGYLDDSITDIMKSINHSTTREIDSTLCSIYDIAQKIMPGSHGYCRTLNELLTSNHFIDHYRSLFNIWNIDFKIELDKRSYNDEGDIILNKKQIKRLEDLVKAHITDVSVLKYDKDIDIGEIVTQKTHIVVCDTTETIYLITYRTVSYYDEMNNGR
jgi:hypothetical protein